MPGKGIPLDRDRTVPDAGSAIYLVSLEDLNGHALPWLLDGRPASAWAPHPTRDDVVYVTADAPDQLLGLSDEVHELD